MNVDMRGRPRPMQPSTLQSLVISEPSEAIQWRGAADGLPGIDSVEGLGYEREVEPEAVNAAQPRYGPAKYCRAEGRHTFLGANGPAMPRCPGRSDAAMFGRTVRSQAAVGRGDAVSRAGGLWPGPISGGAGSPRYCLEINDSIGHIGRSRRIGEIPGATPPLSRA